VHWTKGREVQGTKQRKRGEEEKQWTCALDKR
jgi:hypothetical protein